MLNILNLLAGKMTKPRMLFVGPIFLVLIAACSRNPSGSRNLPPDPPTNPSPADGAVQQPVNLQLSWDCSDPDGDDLKYDLYFGDDLYMGIIDSNLVENSYPVGDLQYEARYLWEVVAKDDKGVFTNGEIWSFTTGRAPGVYRHGEIDLEGERILACRIFVNNGFLYYADGQNGGLQIIRVIDPSSPEPFGIYDPNTRINDMFVEPGYAYIAGQDSSFRVLDISDPANPQAISEIRFPFFAAAVAVRGDYAYVTSDAFKVIDITDRAAPVVMGECNGYGPWLPIRLSGDHACLLHGGWETSFLDIVDISDPNSPAIIGSCFAGGISWSLAVRDDFVHVADHWFGGIKVFDISDPADPIFVLEYSEDSSTDIFISDHLAYCAGYRRLRIFDISEQLNPQLKAVYEFDPDISIVALFVVDPFIYVVDRGPRLIILEYIP